MSTGTPREPLRLRTRALLTLVMCSLLGARECNDNEYEDDDESDGVNRLNENCSSSRLSVMMLEGMMFCICMSHIMHPAGLRTISSTHAILPIRIVINALPCAHDLVLECSNRNEPFDDCIGLGMGSQSANTALANCCYVHI